MTKNPPLTNQGGCSRMTDQQTIGQQTIGQRTIGQWTIGQYL